MGWDATQIIKKMGWPVPAEQKERYRMARSAVLLDMIHITRGESTRLGYTLAELERMYDFFDREYHTPQFRTALELFWRDRNGVQA